MASSLSSPSVTGLPKVGNVLYQTLIEFPCSALTIARQRDLKAIAMSSATDSREHSKYKIDESLAALCQSSETVSSLLTEDPTLAPGDAWKKLYSPYSRHSLKSADIRDIGRGELDESELKIALDCGKWGSNEPSRLFLRLYHDALCTLNDNPAHGMVSPPLLGSSGVMPLTIISVIPDIVRHMSNLIVRAEKEVFLATNFWQNGVASKYITNAIKELSRRAGERNTKVVVKILYDRGSPKQLLEPHYIVSEKEYTGKNVGLPAKHEIPNVDLEVMNYHDPMLGTFHSKFMVVDRKIGIVQSNNIQDNENLEMMVHVEGPIVDSLYDMALLSWHKRPNPPLPSHATPAAEGGIGAFGLSHGDLFDEKGRLKDWGVVIDPAMVQQRAAPYGERAAQKLPGTIKSPSSTRSSDLSNGVDTNPVSANGEHHEEPEAKANGADSKPNGSRLAGASDLGKDDLLQVGQQAIPEQLLGNSSQKDALADSTADDPHYDADITGEIVRVQRSIYPKSSPDEPPMAGVTRHLNHTINEGFHGDDDDDDIENRMTPYVPHPTHSSFPIALVNRHPYGPPNHRSVATPQNAAWLSALRNAQKNVFIQSPTLNAEPLVPAIIETCERGIDVYCYICLGYNDAGELLPMQGGHNEMVAHQLHTSLSEAGRARLHWSWYVGRDQRRPLPADTKRRSCHIKLLIADERVAVVGSGNQDTQSWFHSQEANLLLDSPAVCAAWVDALRRNQNTHRYGAVGRADGVWRGADGREADGAMGVDAGRLSWAKGLVGAVQRLKGTGGF